MPELTIVLPYKGVEKLWNVWAESEQDIDFRRNKLEAERCTACFAALELKKFLTKTDYKFAVGVAEYPPAKGRFIELKIEAKDTGGGFRMTPAGAGLVIAGHGRNGLLNGVYEFLRIQGWRWVEPGERGECPQQSAEIKWPAREMESIPSFKYRCLDAYRESHDSLEYLLWMARNKMNVCFRKSASAKFADKLGMYSRTGGHLLDRILRTDRYLESGKTIWEEYPEWYGLPTDGRRVKESATRIQLCVSQPKLLEYIGDELVKLLNGLLAGVDILDIWGFDTWGKTCSCPECKKTGNGADQNLLLLSAVRNRLDRALETGEIDRKVLLDIVAYEGTVTLEGPTNPVPANLARAGDICIFYPIKRCYRHDLDDANCATNCLYRDALLSWRGNDSGLSIWAGEYYNVSKHEDLPLLFFKRIPHDMRFYHSAGATGATYMHAVFVNWAMRSLTQMQHAQYSWDVNTDDKQFLEDYFRSRYGIYAVGMRKVYALIEEASLNISAWRGYGVNALHLLSAWDGTAPKNELIFGHFKTSAKAITAARHSTELFRQAADMLDRLLKQEQSLNWQTLLKSETTFDKLEYRLGESRRLLVYGLDTMGLLTALMQYHDALHRRNRVHANKFWNDAERVAAKMALYFMPIAFEQSGSGLLRSPGLVSQDALTRTQLRPVITRCRRVRADPDREAYTEFAQTFQVSQIMPSAGDLTALEYPADKNILGLAGKSFYGNFADIHEYPGVSGSDGAMCFIADLECKEKMKLEICLGYDGPVKAWMDGRQVFHDPKGTNPALADKARIPVNAAKGRHEIAIALALNHGKAWGVFLRFKRRDLKTNSGITIRQTISSPRNTRKNTTGRKLKNI